MKKQEIPSESGIEKAYDRMARKYFAKPVAMGNFLREFLPPEEYAELDISSLESGKESYISKELKESVADLVFQCRTKDGRSGSVYVLFEHKHNPAPTCAVQILRYMSMIWDEEISSGRYRNNKNQLPFIIPIVFYHGKEKWTGKQFMELFPGNTPFSGYVPNFRITVCSLNEVPAEKLQANFTDNMMLLLLRALNLQDPFDNIVDIFFEVRTPRTPDQEDNIELFLTYVQYANPEITTEKISQKLREKAMQSEAALSDASFGEYWFPEYFHKVRNEGVSEGKAEGRTQGLQSAVRTFLLSRFTSVKPEILDILNQVNDTSTLNTLVAGVATADTVDEAEMLVRQAWGKTVN